MTVARLWFDHVPPGPRHDPAVSAGSVILAISTRTLRGVEPSRGTRRREDTPPEFRAAVESLCAVQLRPEVILEQTSAPKRVAPYAYAMTADMEDEGASGRLVLLHDPGGQQAWHGQYRLVTFVRAELEPEIAADPMVLTVGWSWLTEAFEDRRAAQTAASGTVTRVSSESFGGMAGRPATAEVEIRASWTPLDADLGPHMLAFSDVLTTAAGLLPLPAGVVPMPTQRGARRR